MPVPRRAAAGTAGQLQATDPLLRDCRRSWAQGRPGVPEDGELRAYFSRHGLLGVYEALLCGVIVSHPEDPLTFLEEKLREIMEKGLDAVLWYVCIDPSLHPKLMSISETYLNILFGLDGEQLMTEELCVKAWDFYSRNLLRVYFGRWIKYNLLRKNKRRKAKQKMAVAVVHYNTQTLMLGSKETATDFNKVYLNAVMKAWLAEAHSSLKTKAYFVSLAKESQKGCFESDDLTVRHKPSHLPEKALLEIFCYISLVDVERCAQVSQTMLLTQNSSLWSNINFSSVKHKVQNQTVVKILQKWRPSVLHLNLRGCDSLHWPSFKSIRECKNLQDFNLSDCQGLNDESMRLISEGCRALLYLNLSYTDITNRTLQLLPSIFPNLQYLSLAHCRKFTDKSLLYLGSGKGCHKLIYLDLSGCIQISVDGFRNIPNSCSGIQALLITKMPGLTDRCIQALVEKCHQIKSVVFLDSPHLSDTTFKALAECKLVVSIEGNNQSTDLSFKLMSKCCPYLRHIHMADCQKITDAGLSMISPLRHIHVLSVGDCRRISNLGVRPFVQGSSGAKLRELNLTNCIPVTDASVTEIPQRCHELTYLNPRYCENVTEAGIRALGLMSSLISIDVSGTSVSDTGLGVLGWHGKIKELSISECKNISDTGIQEFCKGIKDLEYFHVPYCPQLTDEAVKAMALHHHRLTSVNIAGCSKMTVASIQYLAAACQYLHFLDVLSCIHLTDKALKCLWKGCKQTLKMLYCRNIAKEAVLKYTARLEKQEHNDADAPAWLGYNWDGNILPLQLKKIYVRAQINKSFKEALQIILTGACPPSSKSAILKQHH
ncbi:LOW QUALITY PROTEIN: F-box and leucine-rich repeat protein 13 [Porphyrio hochstetteri]